jgi:hypothetical protein
MTHRWLSVASVVVVALSIGSAAGAQGRGRGGGNEQSESKTVVVFRDVDRTTFRDYFMAHKITAEPLPPGIAKNVARGKPLPPGIAKRAVPEPLLKVGPKVEAGVSFAIVGDLVVALKGGAVIDIMAGVFK